MLVRRFTCSELAVHWTLAVSVLLMILSGIALGVNIGHAAAFPVHVGSVFLLAGGVLLAMLAGDRPALRKAARQLRGLDAQDRRWLAWAPRSLLGGGGDPPAVGRFNAGQKLNAMLIGTLLAASTASGLYWWAKLHGVFSNSNLDGAVHNGAGVAIIVLVCGHLYMAVLNPATRHALRGITTGSVDAGWAAEHHPAWLAEAEHDAGGDREARGLELDHVLIAVPDLAAAAREIEARYGLASIEGGRHPGWGTANRIVPLGATYLELIAVADAAEAAASGFGRWVAAALPSGSLLGWAVRTDALDDVAERLGLTVRDGSRTAPDGTLLRWRTAGLEQAAAEPCLPFFIEWAEGTPLPGRAAVSHPAEPVGITELMLVGDPDRIAAWLDGHALPIVVRAGAPMLAGVVLSGRARFFMLT
jgi:formate dehydrogenase subunit gamma